MVGEMTSAFSMPDLATQIFHINTNAFIILGFSVMQRQGLNFRTNVQNGGKNHGTKVI